MPSRRPTLPPVSIETVVRGTVPDTAVDYAASKVDHVIRFANHPVLAAKVVLTLAQDPAMERRALEPYLRSLSQAIRAQGLTSVAEIGTRLRAGSNCGSCIPELKAAMHDAGVTSAPAKSARAKLRVPSAAGKDKGVVDDLSAAQLSFPYHGGYGVVGPVREVGCACSDVVQCCLRYPRCAKQPSDAARTLIRRTRSAECHLHTNRTHTVVGQALRPGRLSLAATQGLDEWLPPRGRSLTGYRARDRTRLTGPLAQSQAVTGATATFPSSFSIASI